MRCKEKWEVERGGGEIRGGRAKKEKVEKSLFTDRDELAGDERERARESKKTAFLDPSFFLQLWGRLKSFFLFVLRLTS